MRWRDATALAWENVRGRSVRSLLTMLAVALAASLFTALLTVEQTAQTRVLSQLSRGGPLAAIHVSPRAEPAMSGFDLRRLARLPNVRRVVGVRRFVGFAVAPVSVRDARHHEVALQQGRERDRVAVAGVDLGARDVLPLNVVAGRLPLAEARDEIALTPGFVERLGVPATQGKILLGSTFALGAVHPRGHPRGYQLLSRFRNVTVVGIVAQDNVDAAVLASNRLVRDMQSPPVGSEPEGFDGAFVVARSLRSVAAVKNEISDAGFAASASEALALAVLRYLHVVEIVLGGIGAIALLISSLGVANALVASVRERRREIGVLKALGARDRDVRRLFLLEAGAFGAIGGALGACAGFGLARAVAAVVNRYLSAQHLAGVHAALPLGILSAAVMGATALALVAGWWPAGHAARLPAHEAVGA